MATEMQALEEITQGKTYFLAELPLNNLLVDEHYQRPLSLSKVKVIAADFSDIAAGALLVNVRPDGRRFLMDGRHRVAAAQMAGRTKHPCMVWEHLSIQQEAQIFIKCNTQRKQPDALQLFKARLFTGDLKAHILKKAVEAAGLYIADYSGGYNRTDSYTRVEAIRAIEYVYDLDDAQTVTYVLNQLKMYWPENGKAFYDKLIKGFALFVRKYRGRFDEKQMQNKLATYSLDTFLREASNLAVHYDNGPEKSIARRFLQVYNSSRPQRTRLPDLIS